MSSPRDFIQQVQQRILSSDREFALDGYAGSIDRLQKAFPRYGSFLMEFIQNADDAASTKMRIELFPDSLRIANDGQPFSEADVKSICKVGRSSKTLQESIGYLGVGFKAVFLISKKPEIYSGPWRFKFEQGHWNESSLPWQVIPVWIDQPVPLSEENFTTVFRLPLHQSASLRSELSDINNRILLFLNHLQELELISHQQQQSRKIIKSTLFQASEYEIVQLREGPRQDRWLLFRSLCPVPEQVRTDPITIEWERQNVKKREVVAAFKLDNENNLAKEEKGTAHIGVFSFLPLKEIPSGLNFLIQADFLTMTGRGELARECRWNNWLAGQLCQLVVQKCIPTFCQQEKWKFNFTENLYPSVGGHELFEQQIKKPLREYLLRNPVVLAEDNSWVKPGEAVVLEGSLRKILTAADIQKLYPGKKVFHPRCRVPAEINSRLERGPSFQEIEKLQELLLLKAQEEDTRFFVDFYRHYLLPSCQENSLLTARLKAQRIILTEDFTLAAAPSAYLNTDKITLPAELKGFFKIVHPALMVETELIEFFRLLGLPVLSAEGINDFIRQKELLHLQQQWPSLSDDEKVRKIKVCQELWEKGTINAQHLQFLAIPSKGGEWKLAEQLLFSSCYQAPHDLERLQQQGLLDFPLDIVSDIFLREVGGDADTHQVSNWYQFFRSLGVDKKLSERRFKKNIIERIGILLALKYEQSKGRKAVELPRSQEIFGYDLVLGEGEEGQGFVQSAERYIEVKSSDKPNPDICLTTRQFSTLQEQRERYFVYVVTDALRSPTLHVTRGDKLLNMTQFRTLIPFHKWWSGAKEEEFK